MTGQSGRKGCKEDIDQLKVVMTRLRRSAFCPRREMSGRKVLQLGARDSGVVGESSFLIPARPTLK